MQLIGPGKDASTQDEQKKAEDEIGNFFHNGDHTRRYYCYQSNYGTSPDARKT
jgi:hypothetical protein